MSLSEQIIIKQIVTDHKSKYLCPRRYKMIMEVHSQRNNMFNLEKKSVQFDFVENLWKELLT